MKTSRPVHLDLTRMKFPPMAIVSILHRFSGVVLFLMLPFLLYLLHMSLHSEESFTYVMQYTLTLPVTKILLWILLSTTALHFFAGVRHMLMDCGLGESLSAGRITAYFVMALTVIAMVIIGVWLW